MEIKRRHNEPHPGEIEMQTRTGTRLAGQRLIAHIHDALSEGFKEFIEAQWMFFLATADDEGRLDCNIAEAAQDS